MSEDREEEYVIGIAKTYDEIPTLKQVNEAFNLNLHYTAGRMIMCRCEDPACFDLHVVCQRAEYDDEEEFEVGINFSAELLEKMLTQAKLIEKGKQWKRN